MIKACFKALVFFLIVHLNSCADVSPKEIPIEDEWTIEAKESFLNDYDTCYLGEQIEFLDNGYYIFKTNCNSEIPYGLIKVGYYELKNDSILFYDYRHSLQASTGVINQKGRLLNLMYYRFIKYSNGQFEKVKTELILSKKND